MGLVSDCLGWGSVSGYSDHPIPLGQAKGCLGSGCITFRSLVAQEWTDLACKDVAAQASSGQQSGIHLSGHERMRSGTEVCFAYSRPGEID